jgi:hypothetical protein
VNPTDEAMMENGRAALLPQIRRESCREEFEEGGRLTSGER